MAVQTYEPIIPNCRMAVSGFRLFQRFLHAFGENSAKSVRASQGWSDDGRISTMAIRSSIFKHWDAEYRDAAAPY